MFLRHFRGFERGSYHLIESVTTYSESQYCLKSVRRQGVVLRDNEPPSFELKNEQKTKLFIHFFDVSKVVCSIIQQLKGCISLAANSTCFKSKVVVSFLDTCVLKALTIRVWKTSKSHTLTVHTSIE